MAYRTRTYIAADWDHDLNAVDQLRKWNDSGYWSLSFTDAHELHQSRDTSKPCSIKASLRQRMDASKRFILVVGDRDCGAHVPMKSYRKGYLDWDYQQVKMSLGK